MQQTKEFLRADCPDHRRRIDAGLFLAAGTDAGLAGSPGADRRDAGIVPLDDDESSVVQVVKFLKPVRDKIR